MAEGTARDPLLQEREKTHGSFAANAATYAKLMQAVSWEENIDSRQRLALSMIFLKIARLTQTPKVKDHWDDIAGYAKLGAEACDV